ncbi:MAG: M23 family metallopeptidase [Spirochaetales bacterium]|nr:M23 family metallopeptidase [Spirochaetales bacterium]
MRLNRERFFLVLLFLSLAYSLFAGEIITHDYAALGEGITVFALPDGAGEEAYLGGEITLTRGGSPVYSRSQFFLYPGDDKSWCALMGIPSDLEKGTYVLTCRMETEGGTEVLQKRIALTEREFPSEVLVLNGSLTDIRVKEDPEKTSQAQRLWSLLASFDDEERYTSGVLVPPMDEYRVTTDYGCRRVYEYADGSEAGTIHNGWDWAAPTGTPLKAVGKGRIVMAEDRIVTGKSVMLELLPGVFVLYYHLDELNCEVGDLVEAGDIVGTVGMTGLATGPHLHWEMRISRVAVDPLPFLEGNLIDKSLYMDKIVDTL